jgi:cytochrome P450
MARGSDMSADGYAVMLEPFGPNIVSTELNDWRLHFKITAPSVGDKVNDLVFRETQRQTGFLVNAWARNGSGNLKQDVYLLALNIMACGGFGRQMEWKQADKAAPPKGHSMTLLTAINDLVGHLGVILLLPKSALRWSPWKRGHDAYDEFEKYMKEMIVEEKQGLATNEAYEGKMKGNLLTAMLKTNASERKNEKAAAGERVTLSDDEVLGNIFMFFMAGEWAWVSQRKLAVVLTPRHRIRHHRQLDDLRHDALGAAPVAAGRDDRRSRPDLRRSSRGRPHRADVRRRLPQVPLHTRFHGKSGAVALLLLAVPHAPSSTKRCASSPSSSRSPR